MADERGEKSESRTKSLEQEAKALEKATERWNNLSEAQRKQDAYHEQLIKNQDQIIDKMQPDDNLSKEIVIIDKMKYEKIHLIDTYDAQTAVTEIDVDVRTKWTLKFDEYIEWFGDSHNSSSMSSSISSGSSGCVRMSSLALLRASCNRMDRFVPCDNVNI